MEVILSWLSRYSAPIVVLLAIGAGLLYLTKIVTEKAVASEFDRRMKVLTLAIERRSRFEEKILLDRYELVRNLETRVESVATNLNRVRHGISVPNLIVKGDVVPLTEVFEQLSLNKYLLADPFYGILDQQASILLKMANESDPVRLQELQNEYKRLRGEFERAMDHVFRISSITVGSSGL